MVIPENNPICPLASFLIPKWDMFLIIGNESNKKIRSFRICYSITAQFLAKQIYIPLTIKRGVVEERNIHS
uniref:Uncharacterized protein n=1 Tax=Medicago truncatula TaxID=3880 RepID=I3SG85_MEDTR|nr:unknown [Medicago truncatula]